jgi:outer membrane autotransporter protein
MAETSSTVPGRSTIGVEAGLTVETSRAMAFGLAVGVEHSGNVTDTTVNASFRYRF